MVVFQLFCGNNPTYLVWVDAILFQNWKFFCLPWISVFHLNDIFDGRAGAQLNKTKQSPLVTMLHLRVFLQRQDINKVHQLGVGWSHFNNYVGRNRLKL